MTIEHLEILVEEPSMEVFLLGLLPALLKEVSFQVHSFQSKSDLLTKLPERLRGYRSWLPESWRILVLVDRDRDDCKVLKSDLEAMATTAGLTTRSASRARGESPATYSVVHRIVIEELEAWYFGDWSAVRKAFPRVSRRLQDQRPFRDPDAISGGTWEAFERVLQRAGYFTTGLRKIEAAREIAPHIVPGRNRSNSFRQFFEVVSETIDPPSEAQGA